MRLGLRAALLLITATMVACTDNPSSATPSSTATTAPSATSAGVAIADSDSTRAPGIDPSPAERRIGIDALDELASAVVASDAAFIEQKLEYVEVPCGGPSVPIPGPECPIGVAVGTPIDAFPHAGCEFTFEPAGAIGPVVDGFAVAGLALLAAYRAEAVERNPTAPTGDYVLVFVRSDSQLAAVAVNADGGIVQWTGSCGITNPDAFLAELPIAEQILPPVE